MKTAYYFIVVMALVAVSMADRVKRNAVEDHSNLMLENNNDLSKRGECKDSWYQFLCKVVKTFRSCDSFLGKKKCAETCGHCFVPKPSCKDKYHKAKCLYLAEHHKCYTDEARANCGTTCESCGKACRNHHEKCSDKEILDELCRIKSGGFLLCPRGCNLCIDGE